ncbi:sn-glycerol-1-phosphate dehydrogenase [Paenibacillus arenilitoris]|uniref:Sn-glycerol-1-phosphate dehydrogenase n=1 Tax=Paenibacillus arenilitoris TaxID=2772299 RepID=A0A927CIT1_9BACL|nr:sn-glycerol-1-phosphate dehydrogenase [Paenibacillus arenilitoris]MBD2868874.1 sn-glycerol-1-phosphate dehydrogenase [Paenibacillus arenilitoris]
MTTVIERIKQAAGELDEQALARMAVNRIEIRAGALGEIPGYLETKGFRGVVLAADAHTYEAAGKTLQASLERSGIAAALSKIKPNAAGDVIADEASIIQLILEIQRSSAQAVLAVGGGTIHDLARYAAYTKGIPFLSVPTSASVDGFNSKGAPIIVRGEKKTILAIGPDAIFADLDVLVKAPPALAAAGFGDMLGKYTSLFDWRFGALTAGEPYLKAAEDVTRAALLQCVKQAGLIARKQEEGIHTLIRSLIESGLAMLLFGQSHPASGAEHHLSHYWEMEYIRLGRRQLLHGAKVGAACAEISKLYHRLAEEDFGRQSGAKPTVAAHWDVIKQAIRQIPRDGELRELLRTVSGPVSTEELSVHPELLARSLREAHLIRPERYTLLHARNVAVADA